jgi:hypothetical protein
MSNSPYDLIEDSELCCPECGINYHHIMRVGTELDPNEDEISVYEGTSLIFERHSGERRSALRTDFEGECGHYWSLILQQYKGRINVSTRQIDSPPVDVSDWMSKRPSVVEKMEASGRPIERSSPEIL